MIAFLSDVFRIAAIMQRGIFVAVPLIILTGLALRTICTP